jgi:hypothetical protein
MDKESKERRRQLLRERPTKLLARELQGASEYRQALQDVLVIVQMPEGSQREELLAASEYVQVMGRLHSSITPISLQHSIAVNEEYMADILSELKERMQAEQTIASSQESMSLNHTPEGSDVNA